MESMFQLVDFFSGQRTCGVLKATTIDLRLSVGQDLGHNFVFFPCILP